MVLWLVLVALDELLVFEELDAVTLDVVLVGRAAFVLFYTGVGVTGCSLTHCSLKTACWKAFMSEVKPPLHGVQVCPW